MVSQGDEGIRFVVLQHRIVARFVLSNQLPFENQGIARTLGDNEVDVVRVLDQPGNHFSIGIGREVRLDARTQVCGLTDVGDPLVSPPEKVDSGLAGQVKASGVERHVG